MKKTLLLTLIAFVCLSVSAVAQVGQSVRVWRGGSTPSGSCPAGSPDVSYNGAVYTCSSGSWAAGSGGGGGSSNLSEAAFASFPTCNSSNKNLQYKRTDGNRDVYTCVYDGSSVYKWRSNNGGVFYPEDFGAKGDGSTNDTTAVNAAIAAAIASNTYGAEVVFGPFEYRADIVIPPARGIKLRGAGRYNTLLRAATSGNPALVTNGLWYSQFEGIYFAGNGGSPLEIVRIDGNYDGTNTLRVQGNTFKDIYVDGTAGGTTPTYALSLCRVGGSSGQCSENLFLNVHFSGGSTAAYLQNGYNALNNTFIGGNFQSYPKHGAQLLAGSANFYSIGFQSTYAYTQIVNGGYDIDASTGGVTDKIIVDGCRSESLRFYNGGASQYGVIRGFNQNPSINTWATTTAFSLNAVIAKTAPSGKIMMYRVTTAGTSGGSEPTWPESGTVSDGTITWTQTDVNVINLPSGDYSERYNTAYFSDSTSVKAKRSQYADVREVTTSKTLMQNDSHVLVDATSGNITITLPDIPAYSGHGGQTLYFRRYDSSTNTVTINGATATGTGTSNLNLPPGGWMLLQISGGGSLTRRWWVVASSDRYTYFDMTRESAPGNPASGKLRLFANDSTGKLDCLDSSGASCMPAGGGGGSGDFSSNTSSSVDGEVVLFSGTGGKTGKRATGSGIAKLASGVLGTAVSGTDLKTINGSSIIGSGNLSITATSDNTITVCASGCDYSTISAAVTGIGGTTKVMKITDAQTVSSTLTIPTNITLWPVGDAMITVSSGTFTINGPVIDPGNFQWIEANSSLVMGPNVRVVRASWWGNNEAGLQKALDSLQATKHELLITKDYAVSAPLILKKGGIAIVGEKDARNGDGAVALQGDFWGPTFQVGNNYAWTFPASLVTGSGTQTAITVSDNASRIHLDSFGMVPLDGLSAFTAELYFKGVSDASQTGGDRATLIGSGAYEGSTYREAFSLYRIGNGGADDKKLGATIKIGSTTYNLVGTTIPQNTTQHIALSYDGTNIRLFQGGTQTAIQAATGTLTQSPVEDVYMAASPGATRQGYLRLAAKGDYDSIRISNNARYTSGFTPSTSKLTSDSNALLVMNFAGTSTQKQSFIQGQKGSTPDTVYVSVGVDHTDTGPGWVENVTIKDLNINNAKGIGLLTIGTPYLYLNNLSVYGWCGWCQEGQSFLSVADGVHASTLVGSQYTRFGIGIFGQTPAGSRFNKLESNGGAITQYIYGSPGTYDNGFVTSAADTKIGLYAHGGGFIFQAQNFQYDDEATPAVSDVRVAQVLLTSYSRVNFQNGYIMSAFGSKPTFLLDGVTQGRFGSMKLFGNNSQTTYFSTQGTAPTVIELDQMERSNTTPTWVSSGLANVTRFREAYQTRVRKDYTGAVGTTTLDLAAGEVMQFTFGAGNETLALSNIPKNGEFTLVIIQDATGSRTITYPSTLKKADGSGTFATQPNTAAGSYTTFKFWCDGTNCYNVTSSIAGGGSGTVTSVNLTAPAAGITVSGGPVTSSGSITLALANDLAAVEGLSSNGLAARTATDTWAARTITGTSNQVTVTNGDGVSGNPTLALPQDIATTSNVRFGNLGLGVASPSNGGQIATTLGANNITGLLIKRNTDTSPTGNYFDFQNAAGTTVAKLDVAGALTVTSCTGCGGSSGIAIGSTSITSGTNTRVLFQSGSVVGQDANLTFDVDTLTTPKIRLTDQAEGLGLSDGVGNYLFLSTSSTLTANHSIIFAPGDANRTLTLSGNLSIAANFTTSGANALTLTTTGATNVTLPTTGTLATLAGIESLTNKKLGSLTSNGLVTTSGGDGALSVTVPGTGVLTALAAAANGSGGFVTDSGTVTLTNKTIDAEGTGNTITITQDFEFVSAGAKAGTGGTMLDLPSSNAPAEGVYTGSNQFFGVLDFDASTDESVQGHFRLPTGWTGAIDLLGEWMAAATSGTVRWALQTACVADGELDPAWNTAQTWGDAAKGTTNQMNQFTQTSLTTTGCAAGERFHFKFYRDADGTSGTDDMTGDARLKSLVFTIRVAK